MNRNNSSSSIWQRRALRYGMAFVAVAAGFGLRVALTAWVGPGLPTYITFYPAVMVAALLAGFGPGLVATTLTGLSVAYWILPPEGFTIASPVDRVGLVLFTGMGLFMSAVAEFYRRDRRKAAAYDREMALRESEERLRFALETSHTGAWDLDLADHTAFRSLEHDRIFGYAELLPKWTYEMFLEHVLPEDRAMVDGKFRRAMETHGDWSFECRIRRADGLVRWIWGAGRHRLDAAGTARRMAGIVQDITERKLAEEALKKAHAELEVRVEERTAELHTASRYARSLLEASLDPLVTISPEGKVTDVNQATELVTGVPREQLIGTDFARYFTEPQKAEAGYQKVLAEGQVRDYPLTIRHTSGRTTEVLYHATVYRNEAGAVQGVFAAARDITEHKRAEAELARYRDHLEELVKQRTNELERSNRDLEQFAYVASHDLQEPLRAVGGYVKLLQHRFPEKLDAKAREYVAGAADGAERMQRLIADLLAFSRVGTRGDAFAPADLNALLHDALNNLQTSIKEAGAKITSDPLPSLPVDATQIRQLFQNLIGNAIKFHSDLTPVIHIGAHQEEERWLFWVRDNGIGIEPQYAGRIFQIFQRLHSRKHYPGTGIGLAICKKIVERHGGEIRVESEPAHGSTFYFSIPEISAKKEPIS
jgi:PAS domain S-box-containing protein